MILTLTAHPSIDTTLVLPEEIRRGSVQRLSGFESVAGGKGINVSQALHKAGKETLAVFPAAEHDLFVRLVDETGLEFLRVNTEGSVRTNTAVTEPDGTTTKLNGKGPTFGESELNAIRTALCAQAADADWVVLAGSLPPGAPHDWYSQLIEAIREAAPNTKIAVDTSDAALMALGENFDHAAPTLIKPNGVELGQLIGVDGEALEHSAEQGDFAPVMDAARSIIDRGVQYVLVTLGAAGAVLVTASGTWRATPPPTVAVSTVGAGDCTLAGFLMGLDDAQDEASSLARGVAYGSAAAGMPGTTIPAPEQINIAGTKVQAIEHVGN